MIICWIEDVPSVFFSDLGDMKNMVFSGKRRSIIISWQLQQFNNDYLSSFNKANVELIDTNGKGVSRLTETGVIANGKEYEVDLLIYSTGFNFEVESDFHRRTEIRILGTKDRTLDETWEPGGPCTLFGLHVPEFPNLFIIGPCQAGVTANWTHTV